MEVEDFDDDDVYQPAQRSSVANPRGPPRRGNAGAFGLASEAEANAGVGLESELQRLDIKHPGPAPGLQPPQPAGGFGLEAEAGVARPTRRRSGGLPPPSPLRGASRGPALQPLRGAGAVGPRARPGLAAMRQPTAPAALPPPRPQDPAAFGLAAEAEQASEPLSGPGSFTPGPPAGPPPASRQAAAQAFGLAAETELRSALPPAAPPLRWQPPPPAAPEPATDDSYGLDQDVQDATKAATMADGVLRPVGQRLPPPLLEGYGLAADFNDAGLTTPPAPAAVTADPYYGLEQEIQTAGPMSAAAPSGMPPLVPMPGGQPVDAGAPPQGLPDPGMSYGSGINASGGYGLENDIQQEQEQQSQLWRRPLQGTLSLEQLADRLAELPDEQRWVHLEARQAERLMIDLGQRGVVPKIVDLKDVRQKLQDASHPPRYAYLGALEQAAPDRRLPPNCRPSLLQAKLKSGQNRLRKVLDPVLDPGGQGFVDFGFSPDGALLPESGRVWQFGLALVQADGVGKTGLQRVRQPCLFIARLALFDRRANRFLGNVYGVRPEAVSNYDKRWEFDPNDRVIVRCSCVQSDPQSGTRLVTEDALSVFVEFNMSYRLAVQDTVNMPQSEAKCAKLLDEINTCWAMISFKKCTSLTREVEINVPLYHGSIYDPKPMTAFYAEKRSKAPFWSSAFKARESPVLQFRVGPLNAGKPPLVPYAYMPPTLLANHDLATALAAYRMSLALSLARQCGPFAAAADPVLAGFQQLLSDHHLLAEFLTRWRDLTRKMTAVADADRGCCSPEVLPPLAATVEAFRRCTIELAPLAHCPTIPPRHINNFVEYQGHRLRLVQHYCHVLDPRSHRILGQRHPVEPLSHAGFEFLHAPFDVAEIRLCMADRLERPEPFYRH